MFAVCSKYIRLYFLKSLSTLQARFPKSPFGPKKKTILHPNPNFHCGGGKNFARPLKRGGNWKFCKKNFLVAEKLGGWASSWSAFYFAGYKITNHTVHAKNVRLRRCFFTAKLSLFRTSTMEKHGTITLQHQWSHSVNGFISLILYLDVIYCGWLLWH